MTILAIETSCDDSACAIVRDGRTVLANVVSSQIELHNITGGVVPEVAAREHLVNILPTLDRAFEESGCSWDNIDAIAVTSGPGLISSLIIGTETAGFLAYLKGKILIPVNHIVGHLYSAWLGHEEEIAFPILTLTVSGGHNDLILSRGHGQYEILGQSLDDAAGEAFDKVARMLGLGYPGGPAISKIALNGDPEVFQFPRAYMGKSNLNFSFSGLKTAVKTAIQTSGPLHDQIKANIAAGFQKAVVEVLSDKVMRALSKYPEIREVHLVGGVSANLALREAIKFKVGENITFRVPLDFGFCTDNAAMIGAAAYHLYSQDPSLYEGISNIVPNANDWQIAK